eukprot:5747315-Lingulodinium_polyedra.AAC.1
MGGPRCSVLPWRRDGDLFGGARGAGPLRGRPFGFCLHILRSQSPARRPTPRRAMSAAMGG